MMETQINKSHIDSTKKVMSDNKLASLKVNKGLTWESLVKMIQTRKKDKQQENVTVYITSMDEYFPIQSIDFAKDADVLDKGHMFLVINDGSKDEKKS